MSEATAALRQGYDASDIDAAEEIAEHAVSDRVERALVADLETASAVAAPVALPGSAERAAGVELGVPPVVAELGLERLPSVDLMQLFELADLQKRFDRKFVVEISLLPELIASLGAIQVLKVDGRRSTSYTSTYFDTPDLLTYRAHLQRRRRRYKIRTRHYGDVDGTMLEVKCKGFRGQTIKHRIEHPGPTPFELGPEAEGFVAKVLASEYGHDLPRGLAPIAVSRFERITLADLAAQERVTIDLGLQVEANGRLVQLGRDHAVVETKSPERSGHAATSLRQLGLRPDRVSKYCVGIAASHDQIRGNPWMPVLRRLDADYAS